MKNVGKTASKFRWIFFKFKDNFSKCTRQLPEETQMPLYFQLPLPKHCPRHQHLQNAIVFMTEQEDNAVHAQLEHRSASVGKAWQQMRSLKVRTEKLFSLTLNLKSLNLSRMNKLALPSKKALSHNRQHQADSVLGVKWKTTSNSESSPSSSVSYGETHTESSSQPGSTGVPHPRLPNPPSHAQRFPHLLTF